MVEKNSKSEWQPFWSDAAIIENGGRYPLLLNRFHDHMEEYLIKGIVSTTDRLRYISYCCWAIGDIEATLECETYYQFEEAFKRRESALAVGNYLIQPETLMGNYSIYGRDVMKVRIDKNAQFQSLSFRILPSQPLGAFGQYYKGTLHNWGLIYVNDEGVICLTDLGEKLYNIMDSIYSKTRYYMEHKGQERVPSDILREWAIVNHYDNIVDKKHTYERAFYKEILFHLDIKQVDDYRRDSLVIYLECILQCNKNNMMFDEDILRNVLYYGRYNLNEEIITFQLSNFLKDAKFYWNMYEMHVYFRWWISELLRTFLNKLASTPSTIDEIIKSIDECLFNQITEELTEKENLYYNLSIEDYMNCIKRVNRPEEYFLEDLISSVQVIDFTQCAAYIMIMLSLLYDKHQAIKTDSRYMNVKLNLNEDYWCEELFSELEMIKEYSMPEFLAYLLNRYVIQKHDYAMYAKNDLRRCWFTRSADKYQFQANSRSIWRPAKHNIICKFLFDMNLITVENEKYIVTEEGNILYKYLRRNIYNEK